MSEREGFLSRWSRLKRQAENEAQAVAAVPPASEVAEAQAAVANTIEADESIDLASLPPIESLDRDSDYTAFLARGVPEALQRLALRQAWRTDPSIAEFRGFAEYDWDCNAPGYGQLLPTDDLARLCDAILGEKPNVDPASAPSAPDVPSHDVPLPPSLENDSQDPAEVLQVETQGGGAPLTLREVAGPDEDRLPSLPVEQGQRA